MARKDLRKKLLLATCSVAFALIAAEVFMRVYILKLAPHRRMVKYARPWDDLPPDAQRVIPHPYLSFALNPNYVSEDGLKRHNRHGFRGDPIDVPKPDGVFRIACLGGSTTYTSHVHDDRLTYPAQLQRILRETYGHENVEVINAGVSAYTTFESLLNLQLKVLPLEPDLVVVYHAVNDVHTRTVPPEHYLRDNTGTRQTWQGQHGWWDHSMLAHYVVTKMSGEGDPVIGDRISRGHPGSWSSIETLKLNPPKYYEANLTPMTQIARANNAEMMFATFAFANEGDASKSVLRYGVREHNDAMRALATRLDVALLPFDEVMPQDTALWSDSVHLTKDGARRKAELFARFIHERFLSSDATR